MSLSAISYIEFRTFSLPSYASVHEKAISHTKGSLISRALLIPIGRIIHSPKNRILTHKFLPALSDGFRGGVADHFTLFSTT